MANKNKSRPLTATHEEPTIWVDDIQIGDVFDLGTVVADPEEILEFAKRFDPQWYHVDPELAKESSWGGLIASGWWTGSSMMGLYARNFLSKIAPDASPGVESLRWRKAVYPGDVLALHITCTEKKPSSRGPHLATLTFDWELKRGDDVVATMSGRGWFHKRPTD